MTNNLNDNKFHRHYPVNIKEEDKPVFDYLSEVRIEIAVKNRILKNAYINSEGQIWQKFKIIKDITFYLKKNTLSNRYYEIKHLIKNVLNRKTIKLVKACWIIDQWSCNYFHWIVDVMQRYHQLEDEHRNEFVMVLPGYYRNFSFINEILLNLQINHVFINEKQIIKASELFIPDFYFPPGFVDNKQLISVKNNLSLLVKESKDLTKPGRIYISRRFSDRRKIANETELLSILKKFDFEIFSMEDLSVAQQISLCSGAEVIIGLHGAGLTNILFMNKGKLLELRMKDSVDQWCYCEMAFAMEHRYYYMLCDAAGLNTDPHHGDIKVDPVKFESILHTMMNS